MSRYALFRRCHEMKGERPLREREMAIFHDGPDRDRKRLMARVALIHAGPVRIALKERCNADHAAMRANRLAIRPMQLLEMSAGERLVVENRVCEIDGHGKAPMTEHYQNAATMSSA